MVQGLPAVKWTPENNTKLLQALVIMHAGAIDHKKLAAIFGPNVPVAAIQYRLGVLRKEGAALGLAESKPSLSSPLKASTSKNGDRAGVVSSGKTKAKRCGRGGMLSDDARDDETTSSIKAGGEVQETENSITANGSTTPAASAKRGKTLRGRITKARISPRKNFKKNYKHLEDPAAGVEATDADGEKIFETDMSDSEDPNASDKEFGVAKQDDAVPMDETVQDAID